MATSQFTIYSSSDPNGPGMLLGTNGSLVSVLNACLVNGYSGKPAAGWTKPLPDISGSMACYKQASGSQFTLFVNDSGPNVASLACEAWVCGYETITSLTGSTGAGSVFTSSYGNGYGYGQFPLSFQNGTYGHVVVRKSSTNDSTYRPWVIAADASTMYMWVLTGDAANSYAHWSFGDIYALKNTDVYRGYIYAMPTENSAPGANDDVADCINGGQQRDVGNNYGSQLAGHFVARNMNGFGGSNWFSRRGDSGVSSAMKSAACYVSRIDGVLPCPNPADNSIWMNPLWMMDYPTIALRGKFRGLYQICHSISNFSDGQVFSGSGDFAGRTFMVVKTSPYSSMWGLEISPTVDTN